MMSKNVTCCATGLNIRISSCIFHVVARSGKRGHDREGRDNRDVVSIVL